MGGGLWRWVCGFGVNSAVWGAFGALILGVGLVGLGGGAESVVGVALSQWAGLSACGRGLEPVGGAKSLLGMALSQWAGLTACGRGLEPVGGAKPIPAPFRSPSVRSVTPPVSPPAPQGDDPPAEGGDGHRDEAGAEAQRPPQPAAGLQDAGHQAAPLQGHHG